MINDELQTVNYEYLKEQLMDTVSLSEYLTEVAGELDVGRDNKIRCPLPNHDDSTPSFFFDDAKKVFKCFGCQKGGTVVELHQQMTEKSWQDSVEDLCKIYKIPIDYLKSNKKFEKKSKGLEYFKNLRKKSKDKSEIIKVKEDRVIQLVEDYAYKLSDDEKVKVYQMCDKLYVSVGLSIKEKENIISEIENKIKG